MSNSAAPKKKASVSHLKCTAIDHETKTLTYEQCYTLEFTLPGLPKMANQLLRGHWIVKHRHAATWKQAVARATHGLLPHEPLVSAALTLTRASAQEPDFDGLVSGFKAVIDGLVECGVLDNDKSKCIGQPSYKWEYASPKKGHIKIKVEEK